MYVMRTFPKESFLWRHIQILQWYEMFNFGVYTVSAAFVLRSCFSPFCLAFFFLSLKVLHFPAYIHICFAEVKNTQMTRIWSLCFTTDPLVQVSHLLILPSLNSCLPQLSFCSLAGLVFGHLLTKFVCVNNVHPSEWISLLHSSKCF